MNLIIHMMLQEYHYTQKKEKIWVDDGESHSLIIGATGSGKTYCIVNPLVHILAKKRRVNGYYRS